ncbi:MAG: class I SAM-dependent methyltransferase [Promethearchaeota archaeon]
MDKSKKRKIEEKEFQKERAKNLKEISCTPQYIFKKYKCNKFYFLYIKEFLFKRLGNLSGKYVCDLGCGEGELTVILAKFNSKILALDLSPFLINLAKKRAILDHVSKNINFLVADAENYNFPKNKFHYIISYGVLHHMDIKKVLPRLHRSLSANGKLVFVEPVNFFPLFQNFISNLPIKKIRKTSLYEKPLENNDFNFIKEYFNIIESRYFNFLAKTIRIFPKENLADNGNIFVKTLLFVFSFLDWIFQLLIPFIKKFYGVVIVIAEKKHEQT